MTLDLRNDDLGNFLLTQKDQSQFMFGSVLVTKRQVFSLDILQDDDWSFVSIKKHPM